MPPRKKTTTKKTTSQSRTRAPRLESFAPDPEDLEVVRPRRVDERIIKLEAASVGLGMAIVIIAALGYWYVFGAPIANPAPAIIPLGGAVETSNEATSENYRIAPVDPNTATLDTKPLLAPNQVKVAIYSTIPVKGAAASLKTALEQAGFMVPMIGNQRPLQPTTTITMKKESQELAESVRSIVEKKYPVATVETLEDSSQYDVIIVIGQR